MKYRRLHRVKCWLDCTELDSKENRTQLKLLCCYDLVPHLISTCATCCNGMHGYSVCTQDDPACMGMQDEDDAARLLRQDLL